MSFSILGLLGLAVLLGACHSTPVLAPPSDVGFPASQARFWLSRAPRAPDPRSKGRLAYYQHTDDSTCTAVALVYPREHHAGSLDGELQREWSKSVARVPELLTRVTPGKWRVLQTTEMPEAIIPVPGSVARAGWLETSSAVPPARVALFLRVTPDRGVALMHRPSGPDRTPCMTAVYRLGNYFMRVFPVHFEHPEPR